MGPRHGMFGTEPYLIRTGENCLITGEVQFTTHDGAVYHLKKENPRAELMKPITIGNDVFIGYRTIILPGVRIGDNVVIGAGSVVTKNIPNNCVAAGIPAKIICSLEDYLDKIRPQTIDSGGMSSDQKREFLINYFNKNTFFDV